MAKMSCPMCQADHEIVKTAAAPSSPPEVHPDQQDWQNAHHEALTQSGLPVLVCPAVKETQVVGGVVVAVARDVERIPES